MKKRFVPIAILTSVMLFSCATNSQVAEKSADVSEQETVTAAVASEDKNKQEEKIPNTETKKENVSTKTETKPVTKTEPAKTEPAKTESSKNNEQGKKSEEEKKESDSDKTVEAKTNKPEQTVVPETKNTTAEESEPEEPVEVVTKEDTKKSEEEMKKLGYVNASSLDAAGRIAKFKMTIPSSFAVYKPVSYKAIPETKIDVTYRNSKNSNEEFVVRKNVGNLDVSDDKKSYANEEFLNYGGVRVFAKGSEMDLYQVVTWISGEYAYSFESNVGFPKEAIFALIQEIE